MINMKSQITNLKYLESVIVCMEQYVYDKATNSSSHPTCKKIEQWGMESIQQCFQNPDASQPALGLFNLSKEDKMHLKNAVPTEIWNQMNKSMDEKVKAFNQLRKFNILI